MKQLFFLFFTLFTSTAYAEEDYSGVWKDNQEQFYSIHQNGSMIMMAELNSQEKELSPFEQGSLEYTDNSMDLAIMGHGFFIIELESGGYIYTRKGSFRLNGLGAIVNERGEKLLTENNVTVPSYNITGIVIEQDGTINVSIPSGELVEFDRVKLALIPQWNIKSFWGHRLVVRDESAITYHIPGDMKAGIIESNALESLNDTAQEWKGYTGELIDNHAVIKSLSEDAIYSKEIDFHSHSFAVIKIEGCSFLGLGLDPISPLNTLCMINTGETPLVKIF